MATLLSMMQVKEDLYTVYKLYREHKHEACWLSACVKFVINSVDLFACDTKRLLRNVFVKLCKKPWLVYY